MKVVGERLVVGVELIGTEEGVQLWGERYGSTFSEIANIPQEIANAISETLSMPMFDHDFVRASTADDGESYRYYLMGKYLLNKRTAPKINKAIAYFRKSVASCPTNLRSHVAIVQGYLLLFALDRISRLEMQTNINPILETLSYVNKSLDVWDLMRAKLKLVLNWDIVAADTHAREALKRNPNLVEAHYFRGDLMGMMRRDTEAIQHIKHILSLDPVSLLSFKQVGRIFYKLGQYENAATYLKNASAMESLDFETLLLWAASLTELDQYGTALPLLSKSYQIYPNIETLSMIGYVEALMGNKATALEIIKRINSDLKQHGGHAENLARIYLAIGEKTKAYLLLEEAFERQALEMYALEYDPRWKTINNEPRFKALVRRVKTGRDASKQVGRQRALIPRVK